jgi:hypothetical protein
MQHDFSTFTRLVTRFVLMPPTSSHCHACPALLLTPTSSYYHPHSSFPLLLLNQSLFMSARFHSLLTAVRFFSRNPLSPALLIPTSASPSISFHVRTLSFTPHCNSPFTMPPALLLLLHNRSLFIFRTLSLTPHWYSLSITLLP